MTIALISVADPRSPAAEAYRVLRTNLGLGEPGAATRMLAVAAPGPGEGASEVAANLAVVTAQAGRRVVLVDADLRRPTQHALFGVSAETGLSVALRDDPAAPAPPLTASGVAGLQLLVAGPVPPDPAECLGGPRLRALLALLREQADVVILDLPPVTAVTDAAVVAPHTDGLLLVLAAGRSRRDETRRARGLMDQVGARVLGVAFIGGDDVGRSGGY
jgi:capsular exopolysaccharide synthesis family protein